MLLTQDFPLPSQREEEIAVLAGNIFSGESYHSKGLPLPLKGEGSKACHLPTDPDLLLWRRRRKSRTSLGSCSLKLCWAIWTAARLAQRERKKKIPELEYSLWNYWGWVTPDTTSQWFFIHARQDWDNGTGTTQQVLSAATYQCPTNASWWITFFHFSHPQSSASHTKSEELTLLYHLHLILSRSWLQERIDAAY